ncbi:MAG TPA: GNAT family N-acetyltransferase [Chitinophagaceae bacterium]|nr:GNAT family N-acetyltransferase [Chitinophagaceae bacterium]
MQKENLRGVQSAAAEKEQGFLTVTHSLQQLQQMQQLQPSIIVTAGDLLAGYALVMPREGSALVPELLPLFALLDKLSYRGRPLQEQRYYVMGQICVAPAFRGQGVFDLLYQQHRQRLHPTYDMVITEVATRNTRSMRAHQRLGFTILHTHTDELDNWAVVGWDWTNTAL